MKTERKRIKKLEYELKQMGNEMNDVFEAKSDKGTYEDFTQDKLRQENEDLLARIDFITKASEADISKIKDEVIYLSRQCDFTEDIKKIKEEIEVTKKKRKKYKEKLERLQGGYKPMSNTNKNWKNKFEVLENQLGDLKKQIKGIENEGKYRKV